MVQQKQDGCIKQSTSKVDVLTIHNRMLEAQITQQATSSTPLSRLPSKPEANPLKQYNCVTLKGRVEESTDIELEALERCPEPKVR